MVLRRYLGTMLAIPVACNARDRKTRTLGGMHCSSSPGFGGCWIAGGWWSFGGLGRGARLRYSRATLDRSRGGARMYQHIAVSAGPFQARSAASGPIFFDGCLGPLARIVWTHQPGFLGLCSMYAERQKRAGLRTTAAQDRAGRRDLSWS